MRGGQEHTASLRIVCERCLQPEPRDRAMWVEQIAVIAGRRCQSRPRHRRRRTPRRDVLAHPIDVVVVQRAHALEIARRADVHRVGHRAHRRARLVHARSKVFRHDIVDIGRRDEPAHGQPDALGNQAGRQVAEVPARDRDDRTAVATSASPAARPVAQQEVVEHLRQQPSEIDRVGGRQPDVLPQLVVGERLLDEPLAVVERAAAPPPP